MNAGFSRCHAIFYMFLSVNYNSIIVKITLKMQHSD
nr:MAG TPA: hypothetical protein [Caudoviricetes sp.]